MILVNELSQFYLPPMNLFTDEWAIPAFTPSHRVSSLFLAVFIFHPTKGMRLSWLGRLVSGDTKVVSVEQLVNLGSTTRWPHQWSAMCMCISKLFFVVIMSFCLLSVMQKFCKHNYEYFWYFIGIKRCCEAGAWPHCDWQHCRCCTSQQWYSDSWCSSSTCHCLIQLTIDYSQGGNNKFCAVRTEGAAVLNLCSN